MKERRNIILNMYFVEKLRPVDIAKKLDISKSAVTQALRKDKRYIQIKQEKKIKNQKKHIEETKEYIKEKRKIAQFKKSADDLVLKNMHNLPNPPRIFDDMMFLLMAYLNTNKISYIEIGIKVLILIMKKRKDLNLKKI